MTKATSRERSWLDFCLSYVDMKWPSAAPKTRDALIDALAAIIPVVVGAQVPDGMDRETLRGVLRHFSLAPASRELDRPPAVAAALRWLEKASLPVSHLYRCARRRTGVKIGGGAARDVVSTLVRLRPPVSLTPGTGPSRGR
jgi:hypothetical protein